MPKKSGQIRIISDGTGMDAVVMDAHDTVLENVEQVTLWVQAGEVNRADVTIVEVALDVKAYVDEVHWECPFCDHTHDHICKRTTLSGD